TVIGYLERPEDGQLRVIDVSRVKYPLRNNSCILFDALFDQEALGEFNNFQMKGFRQGANPTAMTPSPLKRHLMRSFGLRTLHEYVQKFTDDSKLYVEDGLRAKQNNMSLHCLVYLRRSDVNQAFRLTAFSAKLTTTTDKFKRLVKPKLNADRLYDLLSNAEEAASETVYCWWREDYTKTYHRQLASYSNYVLHARGNGTPDTWPVRYVSSEAINMFLVNLINVFHWLVNGTMKYED
ncbi:hypothetical protein FOZ62_006468, partial [Perkinsus olseni]